MTNYYSSSNKLLKKNPVNGLIEISKNPTITFNRRFSMSQIISYSDANEKSLFLRFVSFFSDFGLSKLLLKCNFYKASGFSCVPILKQLFSLIFSGKNLYRALDLNSDDLSFRKNTAYRFLNEGRFPWEKLIT